MIVARNALEKDKLALARAIGLPLEQSFTLADKAPYAAFDQIDVEAAIRQAHANRKDLAAMVEQTKAAEEQRKAATADRLPTLTLQRRLRRHRRERWPTRTAPATPTGTLSVPLFKEFALRGEAQTAQAQLDTARAQLSDKKRAGGRRCARRAAGYCLGAEAGGGGALQRGAGQRGAERSAAAVCQRSQRQPGREPGAAVRGAGQRSICGQPLPAQCGQAQPGARPGRGRRTTRIIWEESKRGGF